MWPVASDSSSYGGAEYDFTSPPDAFGVVADATILADPKSDGTYLPNWLHCTSGKLASKRYFTEIAISRSQTVKQRYGLYQEIQTCIPH